MPKLLNRHPSYRLHRPSGQAVVTIAGKDHYLGDYDSAESRRQYDRVIGEWLAAGRPTFAPPPAGTEGLPLCTVLVMFLQHAKEYYRASDEAEGFKFAISPLNRLYGSTPADQFTPSKLKAVREEMVKLGWSRRYINKQIGRIRMIFKWAVGEEHIPGSVLHGLQAVQPIKFGRRADVRENTPVLPIADGIVDETINRCGRQLLVLGEPHLPTVMPRV